MAMGKNRYKTAHSGQGPVKSGRGYDSLKYNPTRQGTREEPATHKISEEASAQLGASVGFRAPTLYQGQGYQPVKHGNECGEGWTRDWKSYVRFWKPGHSWTCLARNKGLGARPECDRRK